MSREVVRCCSIAARISGIVASTTVNGLRATVAAGFVAFWAESAATNRTAAAVERRLRMPRIIATSAPAGRARTRWSGSAVDRVLSADVDGRHADDPVHHPGRDRLR